mgnify:CR=1 FL=1
MQYASETYSSKMVYTVIYGIGQGLYLQMKIVVPAGESTSPTFVFIKMDEEDSSMKLAFSGLFLLSMLSASLL